MEDIRQYDIVYVNLVGNDFVQNGTRPCIVVSNNKCNQSSGIVTVVPLTTSKKKMLPTHCTIYTTKVVSIALCEQLTCVNKDQIEQIFGSLRQYEIDNIRKCINIQLGVL